MYIEQHYSWISRISPARITGSRTSLAVVATLATLLSAACSGSSEDADGRLLPSDRQVVADATPPDTENVVDVRVSDGGSGESYLHSDSLVWVYDRGVVIKRKANLQDVPDAVVVIGGLARYQLVGDEYTYQRFLTTYNEYEGVPAPSAKDLVRYVNDNLSQIFAGREHNILDIDLVELEAGERWLWHTPKSFSAPFRIRYRQRRNNTTVEDRADTFDVRFYRNSVNEPVHNLLATETSQSTLATEVFEASAIDRMPTLRSNFE
ncbi:MAG: hypothetical protein AAFX56_00760 [Pseudomonadota bacterium]